MQRPKLYGIVSTDSYAKWAKLTECADHRDAKPLILPGQEQTYLWMLRTNMKYGEETIQEEGEIQATRCSRISVVVE